MCGAALSIIVFLFGVFQICASVKINKLVVPDVTKYDAPAVLDCEFILEPTDDYLVLKWYFNKNRTLVYQWIPGSSSPQDLNVLKGRLNLEYKASLDAKSVHRALQILKPGPDLSGEYTCSVSTLQSEDIRTKSMLVFVPEKSLILKRIASSGGVMKIQCRAAGVFPQPVMDLHSQQREISETDITVNERGRLFDITATATLVETMSPEKFECVLRIPQANYTKKEEIVIFPGSKASNITGAWLLYIFPILSIASRS